MQTLILMSSLREVRFLFRDPVLMEDKTAWTHFQCQNDLWPTCRILGHSGLVVSHHVWDNAVKGPCERRARQQHAAVSVHQEDDDGDVPIELRNLLSWFTCVSCFAHLGHNSLRWAIKEYIEDSETSRACWVVLASLRNSFDMLAGYLQVWLGGRIRFEDHPNPGKGNQHQHVASYVFQVSTTFKHTYIHTYIHKYIHTNR